MIELGSSLGKRVLTIATERVNETKFGNKIKIKRIL